MRKLSHTSITLLLLGCISVAIERPFIPEDWEYDLHVSLVLTGALAGDEQHMGALHPHKQLSDAASTEPQTGAYASHAAAGC